MYTFLYQHEKLCKNNNQAKILTRSLNKKLYYGVKGLIRRNTHVKYESPVSYGSLVMTKVEVFEKKVKLQGQGH